MMASRSFQLLTLIALLILTSGCQRKDEPRVGGPFTPAEISLRENGDFKELLDERLTFVDENGTEWIAPRGTLTDGASIPRLALPVTDGRWDKEFLKAAVVHDAYCQEENKNRTPEQYRTRTWQAVHRMFYEACIAGGTNPMLAKIMFAAVWLAGPRWNDPGNNLQQLSSEALTRGFSGSREWIEQNDPTIDEIVADMSRREPLLRDLNRLETGILTALKANDMTKANTLLRDQEVLLKQELDKSPDDLMLLTYEGYRHKNQAIIYQRSREESRAIDELNSSEQVFNSVIEKDPKDPGALNGLGSVSILRGDLNRGEEYIKEALKIAPDYEAARKDLELIDRLRESRRPEQPQ